MSETKEATYKSLLQRMVHMTEQRDFDEDLMKEVYGALLPPRKFEAANEKVARLTAERDDLSRKLAVAEGELTMVRQERDEASGENCILRVEVDALRKRGRGDISRIAELERQLAAARDAYEAERGHRLAAQAAMQSMLANQQPPSCAAATPIEPDKRIGDLPDWQAKYEAFVYAVGVASTTICKKCRKRFDSEAERLLKWEGQEMPPSGPADERWVDAAIQRLDWAFPEARRFYAGEWGRAIRSALKDAAPAARYPEVVEFLDAVGSGPWSMSAGSCEGKASYYVQSFRITKGTWFAGDTLAAACRAALDSRKERSDG